MDSSHKNYLRCNYPTLELDKWWERSGIDTIFDGLGHKTIMLRKSLRKWLCFRPKVLNRYNISIDFVRDRYDDSDTCPLCQYYHNHNDAGKCLSTRGELCPLFEVHGTRCDHRNDDMLNPYTEWAYGNENPLPMIELIMKALKIEQEKENN